MKLPRLLEAVVIFLSFVLPALAGVAAWNGIQARSHSIDEAGQPALSERDRSLSSLEGAIGYLKARSGK